MINLATLKLLAKTGTLWVVLGVLAATHTSAYLIGRAHAKAAVAEQQVKIAQKETKAVVKEAERRAPVVAKKEGQARAAAQRIETAKKDIYYATSNRQINTSCDLSDAEFNGYDVLADEINSAASRNSVRR